MKRGGILTFLSGFAHCGQSSATELSNLQRVAGSFEVGLTIAQTAGYMRTLNRVLALLPVLSLAGCIDEPVDEAEVDALNCTLSTYRIVSADVPLNAVMATAAALDLDADALEDNSGGSALAAFLQQFDSADGLPTLVNERLASEEAPWFIALNQCPDGRYLFWTLRGEDFNGDGVYELSSREAPPAQGTLVGSSIHVTGGGFGEIPVGIFADPLGEAREIWSSGAGLAAEFSLEDGDVIGKLGLGLADNYFEIIGRPMAAFFTSRLQAGTSEFAADLDTNDDGIVSLAEFEISSIVQATLLNPDLDLLRRGSYNPGRDGVEDSLSFSFAFRAEPAIVRWQ
jgi:hypothetical protein